MPKTKLKIVFLGRKPGGKKALEYIAERAEVVYAVAADDSCGKPIISLAESLKIPIAGSSEDVCGLIGSEKTGYKPDLVISYLCSEKIKEPLLSCAKLGAINFHPGPLPDYKGWASYNYAILNGLKAWGASAHYMDKDFDAGPIIKTIRFEIDPLEENCHSLEAKTQAALYHLFTEVMDGLFSGKKPDTAANGSGKGWTKKEMEQAKLIDPERDSVEEIDKKIRAYFFPPYSGATLLIKGKPYTLVNDDLLKYIDKLLKNER
jgi:methionyl-tRNA formyltransferase